MPLHAVYNEKIITPEDIYKFNIDKDSDFRCFVCDKQLHFRQSRNGEKKYYFPLTLVVRSLRFPAAQNNCLGFVEA